MKLRPLIITIVFCITGVLSFAQDKFLIIAPDDFMDELEVLQNYKNCTYA